MQRENKQLLSRYEEDQPHSYLSSKLSVVRHWFVLNYTTSSRLSRYTSSIFAENCIETDITSPVSCLLIGVYKFELEP